MDFLNNNNYNNTTEQTDLSGLEALGGFGLNLDEQSLSDSTAMVNQMLDSALNTASTAGSDIFSEFEEADDDEFEDVLTEEQKEALIKIQTLVRVFDDNQALKIAYIRHGTARNMSNFQTFLLKALTAKFKGKNAAGAYSEALIQAKEQELKAQFILLDIEPTQEEINNAKLFNDKYKEMITT